MKTQKVVLIMISVLFLNGLTNAQINSGSEKRLALVVGNGSYTHSMELANPVNDARAMKEALTKVGFEVDEYENLDQAGLKRAIDRFGDKLKQYSVGLFFYAGHGIQSKGSNYLIPVNAEIQSEQQVEYDCVQADRVLGQMEAAGSKINIVILDACRNNPFERSWSRAIGGTGLAFMNAPSGSLIAYSTSPGRTASDGSGSNGLYTSALLENIKNPGINILQMFQNVRRTVASRSDKQQIPWESTSLTNDFFFVNNPANKSGQKENSQTLSTISQNSQVRNEETNPIILKWKNDGKDLRFSLNGNEIQERLLVLDKDKDWLVYDPVTKCNFLLPEYSKTPLNQVSSAKLLGGADDAVWKHDSLYYYIYYKGVQIAARTKNFHIDNDLLVYDQPTNTTYMLEDFTHRFNDHRFYVATIYDNADFAFWRREDMLFRLFVKGDEIQERTKYSAANKDLLVYDEPTNTTYLMEGFYIETTNKQLKPARVISYMDDVLWMKSENNTYWLFSKGDMISEHTTNTSFGDDLYVTDTVTNNKYILYDFFNCPENQFKTAYKTQD